MFKNIEYDLLNISKQMEHLDTQKDVEIFVEEQKGNGAHRIMPEEKREDEPKRVSLSNLDAIYCDKLEEKPVLGKSMLSESILYVE